MSKHDVPVDILHSAAFCAKTCSIPVTIELGVMTICFGDCPVMHLTSAISRLWRTTAGLLTVN